MKFKKEIATLLLVSALLTTPLTACQKVPDDGDKIDNTTPEITTAETTPETQPNIIPDTKSNTDLYAFYKYEEETGGKVYLQIDAWNQTLPLPFTYETDIEKFWILYDATIVGDKGIFVYYPDNDGTSIKILSFTKSSDEITEQTITWDETICQSKIFCNFIDDENGYIFVIEEIDASGFASGAQKIAKLYKTQNGGKTWDSLNCDNIPYISLRYSLMLAKFVTEDIGIIAGHLGPDDFNFHERTYITKDGGLSWIPVDLSNFADLFAYQVLDIEAYDLQYLNNTYYLYVEDRYGESTSTGTGKPCYLFTSTDGVEWSFLKEIN